MGTTEGRKALKQRLVSEGRWNAYVIRREALRKEHPLDVANDMAAAEFAPLPAGMTPSELPAAADLSSNDALNAAARVQRGNLPAAAKIDPESETTAADFAGKPAEGSQRDNLIWVSNNYTRTDVTPKDAPTGAAWNLLCAIRANPRMVEIFWGQMYIKTMPTQKELDDSSRFSDKGSVLANLMDSYEELLAVGQQLAARKAESDAAERKAKLDALNPFKHGKISHTASPALAPSPGPERSAW